MDGFATLDGEAPLVIAHRGASGLRPEHTLEAYKLAIQLGADFIEPDLVTTRDGVLIDRHEPELGGTTDVASHPEFADRYTTKMLDGAPVSGWFAEDFTLAEIKTLRAVERIPDIRPGNTQYNGLYEIPTLDEVIALVKQVEAETGRQIGIIPETKHPTYFAEEGTRLDGAPIHTDTSQLLIDTLVRDGFTDPDRVTIQSFETENLIRLQTQIMPKAGIDIPLIQLMNEGGYDITFNFDPSKAALGADPSVYAEFHFPLSADSPTNGDLYTPEALQAMHDLYAELIGPYKDDILPTITLDEPVGGITRQLTGEKTSLVDDAHAAGLKVILYTLRDDLPFASLYPDGTPRPYDQEYRDFIATGVDGFFTDFAGTGRTVVDAVAREISLAPQHDYAF
ncbi:glycerophosphodiester phosphodiesterase family protein [Paracraurococcus lichenis]|uniref:glycerophosphodiester phosphodiesterase n=1 Tax=Paracraurococcus lichenis TaxID=3064888 RepID=A0ABT9E789_9PROT|nr:glycerophosphodiester phosphodiesterase family protein [Paracraurococcus sp. LOR1-02]MDO9712045.1 glycerophosphodiester phosphodiesterase family protein [Paracraurococcus sp. LOR1-02]